MQTHDCINLKIEFPLSIKVSNCIAVVMEMNLLDNVKVYLCTII